MQDYFFEPSGIAYRRNEFVLNRPTLVFIHGLSGSCSAWYAYEKQLTEQYNLLTFDLPGHGKSKKRVTYSDYSVESVARDLYHLVVALNIKECTLVSHSYGTLVALEFNRLYPKAVTAQLFLSPAAFLSTTALYYMLLVARPLVRGILTFFPHREHLHERVSYVQFGYAGDWDIRRIRRDLQVTGLRSYLYYFLQMYTRTPDVEWQEIRVPVHIMHGNKDTYVRVSHAARLEKEIKNATLEILPGANHMIVLNNVSEVTERIRSFVH